MPTQLPPTRAEADFCFSNPVHTQQSLSLPTSYARSAG